MNMINIPMKKNMQQPQKPNKFILVFNARRKSKVANIQESIWAVKKFFMWSENAFTWKWKQAPLIINLSRGAKWLNDWNHSRTIYMGTIHKLSYKNIVTLYYICTEKEPHCPICLWSSPQNVLQGETKWISASCLISTLQASVCWLTYRGVLWFLPFYCGFKVPTSWQL